MFLILKETIAFGSIALLNKIKKLEPAKSLANLLNLLIHKGQGQPTQINLIVLTRLLEPIFAQIPLLKKLLRFNHLKGCGALNIIDLRMTSKEILNFPGA
jgi:hypothetical protein